MSDPCFCGRPASDHLTIVQASAALTAAADFIVMHRGEDATIDDVVPFLPPRNPFGCPQNDLRGRIARSLTRAGITVCGARLS